MNRKGFTLIELLAVIVILGIILTFTVPNIINIYKDSKLKTEEMFLNELSKSIDSYVSLEASSFTYGKPFSANKTLTKTVYNRDTKEYEEQEMTLPVTVSSTNVSIQSIIDDGLIKENDYINPGNKDETCNKNDKIVEVYRDSDYVYCHKIKKEALKCLTDEYKNSLDSEYAVDTCIWK